MPDNILEGCSNAVSALEIDNLTAEQTKEALERCLDLADSLPAHLPAWITGAAYSRYGDIESLSKELPDIISACYNKDEYPVCVLTPDIVLAKSVSAEIHARHKDIPFFHVRNENFAPVLSPVVILLCPGRYHSQQIQWISTKLPDNVKVLSLDPDGISDIAGTVKNNDKHRLEFLTARWEIETEPAVKKQRIADIATQFRAMTGGE